MTSVMFSYIFIGILMQIYLISAKLPDWIPADMINMVAEDKNRCMSEHGTTQALIDEVNDGVIPNDPKITCYMYCLFESFSLIDEDGVLEAEMLAGFFPEDLQSKGAPILNACATQDGADNCEKMYKIGKCIQDKAPELWFML